MNIRNWADDADDSDDGRKPCVANDYSKDFEITLGERPKQPVERETDHRRLEQRQKQIDYGKNTLGYVEYSKQVPRHRRGPEHPTTPDKFKACSKRAFDGLISKWRRELHKWDPSTPDGVAALPIATALPPPPPPTPDGVPAVATPSGLAQLNGSERQASGNAMQSSSNLPSAGSKRRLHEMSEGGRDASLPAAAKQKTSEFSSHTSTELAELGDEALHEDCEDEVGVADIYGSWDDDFVPL